jgi:hypothetical protein
MSITGRYITMRGGNIIGTPPVIIPPSLLLDLYPATAAYSVRKLRTAYTGACMRVRRSSDNTEQDIGFVDNDLDTASLLSFVGANDGFVTTWYDQQGSNNATQTSLSAQPQIVSSGDVITKGSKSSLDFNGTSHWMQSNSFTTLPQPNTKIVVNDFDAINFRYVLDGSSSLRHILGVNGTGNFRLFAGNITDYGLISIINTHYLQFAVYNGVNSRLYYNGITLSTVPIGTNGLNQITIGRSALAASQWFDGNLQEVIIFGSDETANRTAMQTNINDYYGIY